VHPFPPVPQGRPTRAQRRDLRVQRTGQGRWPRRIVLVAVCALALVVVPIALSPTRDVRTASDAGAEQALRADDPAGRSASRSPVASAPPASQAPAPAGSAPAGSAPAGSAPAGSAPAAPPVAPAPAPTAPTLVDEIVTRTNAERATAGLPALAVSPCATEQAAARTATLAAEDRFEHDPLEPVMAACSARAVGENLALGYPTALAVVAGWMGSDGHRANILGTAYTQIGVGCATGPRGLLCAQVFLG
jgi:uncharacterized protein YkwD